MMLEMVKGKKKDFMISKIAKTLMKLTIRDSTKCQLLNMMLIGSQKSLIITMSRLTELEMTEDMSLKTLLMDTSLLIENYIVKSQKEKLIIT